MKVRASAALLVAGTDAQSLLVALPTPWASGTPHEHAAARGTYAHNTDGPGATSDGPLTFAGDPGDWNR
jgi:hypothetical protein